MIKLKLVLVILFFMTAVSFLKSQELVLKHQLTQEEFTFENSSLLRVELGQSSGNKACCNRLSIFGQLRLITEDSLWVKANEVKYWSDKDNFLDKYLATTHASGFISIPRSKIAVMEKYASLRQKRWHENKIGISGLLILSGLLTSAHYFAVNDRGAKNTLLISGGAQFSSGLILALWPKGNGYRKLETGPKDPWKFID